MNRRLELQTLLETTMGSDLIVDKDGSTNVYFHPPPTVKIKQPAIIYSKSRVDSEFADDELYKVDTAYTVIAVFSDPDSDLPGRVLRLPKCRFDRRYSKDNLYYEAFRLYY